MRKAPAPQGGLVYSTDGGGRMCPRCRHAVVACTCAAAQPQSRPPGDGIVRVSREVQGRKGKVVTVVRGLALDAGALAETARLIKASCGTGGSVSDGAIEIQGEQRDRVVAWLQSAGYTVRRAGG